MLTYKCKKCTFSFSEADKAWDIAIAHGTCPKCMLKLENFYVSEADSQLIRINRKEVDFQVADESIAETMPPVKVLLYIVCLFVLLLVILTGGSASFFVGLGAGKIIVAGIFGLVLLINYIWKQLKRKKMNGKLGG